MADTATQVAALLPGIRSRRAEIEASRTLPADIAASLQKAGVFAVTVPKALGGAEGNPLDHLPLLETIAQADGSTGWCAMIGQGLLAGYMSELGAKEVYQDPTIPIAGVAGPMGQATRVDGGVKISGRWGFASGILHSPWVWGGAFVFKDGAPVMTPRGPELIHVFMPKSDVEVHDTWHTTAMAGTGSNDFSCTDVFVPDHLVWSLLDVTGHRSEPLYQLPAMSVFASSVAAVALGIARAALDEVTQLAASRMPPMSMQPLADKPAAQLDIAQAEARLRSARAFLYETLGTLWDAAQAGREPAPKEIAFGRIGPVHAAETAAEIAQMASRYSGAHAIYQDSEIARHARDAEAISHHFVLSRDAWEQAGRLLLDRPLTAPVF